MGKGSSMGGKTRRAPLSDGTVGSLGAVALFLEHHPGQGAVIGGIGMIARGVRRLTRDVDISLATTGREAPRWIARLGEAGIVPRIPDAAAFAATSQVLLMRHQPSGVDIDVSLASLPFEMEAISQAPLEVIAGVRLPIARAEDLVIYKALAWRAQDQQDVERLLALHGRGMTLARVRRHVKELGDALEVDRLSDLDALIRRVLG